ncbi:transcription factor bHLH94-like [Bidens hawaiensis]|uniref:transcription factor bHLH94-like n=1 Tax=Bidens hawaiensis TaxID=980011 RepID=UPI0040491E1D
MALDTVFYPHDQIGIWGYDNMLQDDKSFYGFLESNNLYQSQEKLSYCSSSSVIHNHNIYGTNSSPEDCISGDQVAPSGRKKRRRTKSGKNKEELENQRMTHITVERNRRKQMNEYLAVIRTLMPSSYVQRGDQASIIGGAINFVKELEQKLQTLEVQKRAMHQQTNRNNGYSPPLPFGEFFTFPQYSIRSANEGGGSADVVDNRAPAMAEIEVTMVENHANLKILSRKRHRQLLRMVGELQCLWLTVLHLNVTTVDNMVFYSLSVKLEDGCQLSTVDDIATAVNCILGRIEEQAL